MTGWQGTPGPWGIAPETNGTELVAYSTNPWRVRAVIVRGDMHSNPNWRHDTKGMAAVPQLVEALLVAAAQFRSYEQHHRAQAVAIRRDVAQGGVYAGRADVAMEQEAKARDTKANRNAEMADQCEAALRAAGVQL